MNGPQTLNSNPLWEARERLRKAAEDAPRHGHQARSKRRRLAQQQIERIALTALEKYLPKLFHPTPEVGQFSILWPHFIEGLGLACRSEAHYRAALMVVIKLLHLGNTRQCWSLPLPTLPVTVQRRPQRQSERWLQHGSAIMAAQQQWLTRIEQGNTPGSEQLLVDIVQSAAMHSGLNSAARLYQLALAVNQRTPLWHNGQQLWLAFSDRGRPHPTNTTAGSEPRCEWRFFPALPTLGLLWRWYRGRHQCALPADLAGFDLWLRPRLAHPLPSLDKLARFGTLVAECQPGVAWPQILVGVANGSLSAASLPHASWQALHQSCLPSVSDLCQLPLTAPADPDELATPASQRQRGRHFSPFLDSLRRALAERASATTKMTAAASLQALRAIDTRALGLAELILHGWCCHALEHRRNKPSSLRTYLANGGVQWLTRCHGHDIGQWSGETWLAHYHALLEEYRNPTIPPGQFDHPTPDGPPATDSPAALTRHASYVAERLTQLHQYGVRHHGLAPLPESLLDGVRSHPHVRAGLISEPLFNTLLQALAAHPGLNDRLREQLILITLLARRAGLRLSELIKLRVQDIDDHPEGWLRVRNTALDDGKSPSARRNIPIRVLLTQSEAARLQQYVNQLHSRYAKAPQALLFASHEGSQIPLTPSQITTPIITLLRACGGYNLVFHHLRHSALGKLQLTLHHHELALHHHPVGLWRNLLPWDAAQCRAIVTAITADHAPSSYWALAQCAGHLGPDTTLHSYLHLCDWISAGYLQQAEFDWTPAQRRYFTGLSDHQLQESGLGQGSLSYPRCWPLLQHKMRHHLHLLAVQHSEISPLPPPPKRKIDFFVIVDALRQVEQGKNLQGLLGGYDLSPAQISEWLGKARALGQLRTRRQRSRLLAEHRKRPVLPGAPRSHAEQQALTKLVSAARRLYRREPVALSHWLRYLLLHTTTSKHGIHFSDPAPLQPFIATTCLLLPAHRLEVTLHVKPADLATWQRGLPKGISQHQPTGTPQQRNRAILRVRHPDEHGILTRQQAKSGPGTRFEHYSSPVLILLAYVISLQLFTQEEIEGWGNLR